MDMSDTSNNGDNGAGKFDESLKHCMRTFYDTQTALFQAGAHPAVMAQALASTYVAFIASMTAMSLQEKDSTVKCAIEGLEMLSDYADSVYDSVKINMENANKGENKA